MSSEDLERYETEIELQLYREYRDVLPMFQYVVETERRFYLANEVNLEVKQTDGRTHFDLRLRDAWVWDMYRQLALRRGRARRDLPGRQHRGASRQGALTGGRRPPRATGVAGEDAVAAWYVARGYEIVDRNWRVPRRRDRRDRRRDAGSVVFCEVKTRRGDAFGAPVEAVTARKQQRLRLLARLWLADQAARVPALRFDVASVMPDGRGGWTVDVLEAAF